VALLLFEYDRNYPVIGKVEVHDSNRVGRKSARRQKCKVITDLAGPEGLIRTRTKKLHQLTRLVLERINFGRANEAYTRYL